MNGPYKIVYGLSIAAKCMTLNDLWARFKVIKFIKCNKNDEIQLSRPNDTDAMYSVWAY